MEASLTLAEDIEDIHETPFVANTHQRAVSDTEALGVRRQAFDGWEQVPDFNIQCFGDADQVDRRDIAIPSFYTAKV